MSEYKILSFKIQNMNTYNYICIYTRDTYKSSCSYTIIETR